MDMTVDDARPLYSEADSVHDFDHILRVVAVAERIAVSEGADLGVVRAAALLHDWGRAEAQAADRNHADVAADRAECYLRDRGASGQEIAAICHAIRAHRFRAAPAPATLEARVLFDADKLDAIGALGVARAYAYGGAHHQRLWAPADRIDLARWEKEGDDSDAHTPVHEFVVKLSRIRAQLYTQEGRRIAEERHRYMVGFFERLDAEVRGEL